MKADFNIFRALALSIIGIFGAVASPPVIDPVGPSRPVDTTNLPPGNGALRVFSDTYKVAAGRDGSAATHPHSGFVIFRVNTNDRQHVENHGDGRQETPVIVPLPAGRYLINARCAGYGSVTVPVQIVVGQLTQVYLAAGGMPIGAQPAGRDLVRLPNGHVVGVRAMKRE